MEEEVTFCYLKKKDVIQMKLIDSGMNSSTRRIYEKSISL